MMQGITPLEIEAALAALALHGSQRKAAAALGICQSTLQLRLKRAAQTGRVAGPPIPQNGLPPPGFIVSSNSATYDGEGKLRSQSVQHRRDAGGVYAIPDGHIVKGESVLLDPDGRTVSRWVKTGQGSGEGLADALRTAFSEYAGTAPSIPAPAVSDDDFLTVYPLPDLHLGMLSWGRETGANYDTKIATDMAIERIGELVAQSKPSARAVLLGLGDYFHSNDAKAVTPGSGHSLDTDARWPKIFAAGAKLATSIVDMIARKHASVEVVFLPGNHDPDAAICLTVALALFYQATDRITVHQEPGIAWYSRFGSCLLGATHGHTMKPERMAMMLATDRAQDWGETQFRQFFFGHVHSEHAREVGPVRVESFSSPASRDAWNAASGYRAGRSLSAITFHRERGEIGRHRVNIISERAA